MARRAFVVWETAGGRLCRGDLVEVEEDDEEGLRRRVRDCATGHTLRVSIDHLLVLPSALAPLTDDQIGTLAEELRSKLEPLESSFEAWAVAAKVLEERFPPMR